MTTRDAFGVLALVYQVLILAIAFMYAQRGWEAAITILVFGIFPFMFVVFLVLEKVEQRAASGEKDETEYRPRTYHYMD